MDANKRFLIGVYDDDDEVLAAVKQVKSTGVRIHEVYTPFPIHGLDRAIGHPRTRLPIAAFMYGTVGLLCATALTIWTMGFDWPIIIGGKDWIAFPDFIPIMFEMTVLFTAFGMVITFFLSNGLWWGNKARLFDLRTTDDRFVMAIDLSRNKMAQTDIERVLRDSGAIEVNVKEIVE